MENKWIIFSSNRVYSPLAITKLKHITYNKRTIKILKISTRFVSV